jgi:hypothetical protein
MHSSKKITSEKEGIAREKLEEIADMLLTVKNSCFHVINEKYI